jgi:hypothetical protein
LPSIPFSTWLLFFDIWDFDGDAFILVVTSVFTRIRSGAARVAATRWR